MRAEAGAVDTVDVDIRGAGAAADPYAGRRTDHLAYLHFRRELDPVRAGVIVGPASGADEL